MNPLEIDGERAESSFSSRRCQATGHRLRLVPFSQRQSLLAQLGRDRAQGGFFFPAVNAVLNKTSTAPARAAHPCPFLPETPSFLPPAPSGARGVCCCASPRFSQDSHLPLGQTGSCLLEGLVWGFPWGQSLRRGDERNVPKRGTGAAPRRSDVAADFSATRFPFRPGSYILSLFQSRPWPAAWRRSRRGEPPSPAPGKPGCQLSGSGTGRAPAPPALGPAGSRPAGIGAVEQKSLRGEDQPRDKTSIGSGTSLSPSWGLLDLSVLE